MSIILDYKKDKELFNETALETAKKIGAKVKTTQIRKFFDKVLELNQKAKHCVDFQTEVLPFVKMMNSKVVYAQSRNLVNNSFENMMKDCINQVNTKEELEIFKLFFESVIGFHKSIEK